MWVVGGFCGSGGSVWVMGEWSVGQWIVGVISFQKMYGLYGLKHQIVEISGDVTDADEQTNEQTTRKHRATQLLICEKLSLAIEISSTKAAWWVNHVCRHGGSSWLKTHQVPFYQVDYKCSGKVQKKTKH